MPLSLSKPTARHVGWSAAVNQNWTDVETYVNSRRLPKGYALGLLVRYASATTCTIGVGSCRSSDDVRDISLSSQVTVDITTTGANGLDEETLSGTGSTDGSSTLTGSGTSFLTAFGTRDLTGTISSSGTTVTGTSTKFLSEVSVDDLIGNSSKGYYRITAIASDTSLTIASAPGSAFSSEAAKCVENPTVSAGSDKRRVNTITSDTALTATTAFSNGGAGQTVKAGVEPSVDSWFAAWVISGGSGTAGFLSTQRTTLLNPPSGYDLAARRIGWLRNSTDLLASYQVGAEEERDVIWEIANAANGTQVLTAGNSSGAWTDVVCSSVAPPTARQLLAVSRLNEPTATTSIYYRERALGVSTVTRNHAHISAANDDDTQGVVLQLDGAQAFQYSGGGGYADVFAVGYRDTL